MWNHFILIFWVYKFQKKESKDELSDISNSSESSDNDSIPDIGLLKLYNHKSWKTSFDEWLLSDNSSTSSDGETLKITPTKKLFLPQSSPWSVINESYFCLKKK